MISRIYAKIKSSRIKSVLQYTYVQFEGMIYQQIVGIPMSTNCAPLIAESKVDVNIGTLCISPCGHDTDYSYSPISFRLHMSVVDDERRNPIDFGSWGHRSRSSLALCV